MSNDDDGRATQLLNEFVRVGRHFFSGITRDRFIAQAVPALIRRDNAVDAFLQFDWRIVRYKSSGK
jgi:hypothetical protein